MNKLPVLGLGLSTVLAGTAASWFVRPAMPADTDDCAMRPHAGLTTGERRRLKTVFGDAVANEDIRITFCKHERAIGNETLFAETMSRCIGSVCFSHNIIFYGAAYQAEDYAATDAVRSWLFDHEATHVAQAVMGISPKRSLYSYDPKEIDTFKGLKSEQQATLVADFAALYIEKSGFIPYVSASSERTMTDADKTKVAKTVTAAFPAAHRAICSKGLTP